MNKQNLICFLFLFLLFLVNPFSVYAEVPVKILIVPGHDNEVWGAQYGHTKEADMTLALGTALFNLLKEDKRFEVFITRDQQGYTNEFSDYFKNNTPDIISFRKTSKEIMKTNIQNGTFIKKKDKVQHNLVSERVAMILYGINKWANDHAMDAVIHIHFNDYPRKNKWTIGEYKGFVIYAPEAQMVNSKESLNLAKNIFTELRKKYITSTYKKENSGIVTEQSLIALGSNGTLVSTVSSLLIEYGYIYRFGNDASREKAYKNMSLLTAEGIKNYFFPIKI